MTKNIITKQFAGVTFTCYIETSKAVKRNFNQVMLCIYHNRKYLYHNLGFSADNGKLSAEVAKAVDNRFSWIYTKSVDLINNEEFSFQRIKDLLSSGVVGCSTFNELFKSKVDRLEKANQLGTHRHYRCALACFERVLGKVSLSDFGPSVVSKWVKGMSAEGLSATTQRFYLQDLKAVTNEAIYHRHLKDSQYPFKRGSYDYDMSKVRIPSSAKRTEQYITLDKMQALWNWNLEHKCKYISIFLLSYLSGGANLADLLTLEFDEHYRNSGGKELAFIRKKTAEKSSSKVRIPVTSKLNILFDILNPEREGRVLRFVELGSTPKQFQDTKNRINSKLTFRLPKIMKGLGCDKKVTLTYARHSFATIATKLQLPYAFVEEMMGHTLSGVRSHYIGSYTTEELIGLMEKVL